MQDARVWKELKDGDGDSFFFSPKAEEEEIRLGVSFSLDWYEIHSRFQCPFIEILQVQAKQKQFRTQSVLRRDVLLYPKSTKLATVN
jgi:hypothetical protein